MRVREVRMIMEYCPCCGTKAEQKFVGGKGKMSYCNTCKKPLFSFSYSCILTLIIDEYRNFAFIQQYNIPCNTFIGIAGYLNHGETFEEAVRREVFEEVGLVANRIEYIRSYYYEQKDLLMVGFITEVNHAEFRLSIEADNAKWFAPDEVKSILPENSITSKLFMDYISRI